MAKKITNTAITERHPEWTMGGNPGAIEQQEARGQKELVASEMLPVNGSDDSKLTELGIKFGDVCKDDKLFRHAKLPAGWKKRPTDHSMWSEIVDDKGVVRAMIFYKAAFYDRWAFIRIAG